MSLDLEPIKARIARATPGPWRVKETDSRSIHRGTVQVEENGRVIETVAECYCGGYEGHGLRNAELVANAPTDLDALVAEVERLREFRNNAMHAGNDEVAEAVAEERAAVVAYLRDCDKRCREWDGRKNAARGTYRLAAAVLERGEHRREEEP